MATPFHTLLANSLKNAKKIAQHHIIKSSELSRLDRERLLKADCLYKIVKGWYLLCPSHTNIGESTPWYASFWDFLRIYLTDRFGEQYCLSPEASMDLYLGKNYIPAQIVVIVKSGGTIKLNLPHNTSLLIYQDKKRFPKKIYTIEGLSVIPFELALCKMPPHFYIQQPQEAEIALTMLKNPEKILHFLLKDGMAQSAGRIIGGLRHINNNKLANRILETMEAAGFSIIENNPFKESPLLTKNELFESPYSARIKVLWKKTRGDVIALFPKPVSTIKEKKLLIKNIDTIYIQDAYHSLSIEGYQVSEELIEKIATGKWRPDDNEDDRNQKNAMAAKGYYEAFNKVKSTINKMIASKKPIDVLKNDFQKWYLALFSSSVTAGILSAAQLSGYRNQPVYIRNAQHVPPPYEAVRNCMLTLFDCLKDEENPAVKAVLAHWLIGFIHPYIDGNGRIARFMMNALLVSSGYPWTVIHLENRSKYLASLEKASIQGDIKDFAKLILKEMKQKK